MDKIDTKKAPQAIGPYSQAILVDGFLFISGQIPIDPKIGKIVDFTITGQTRQVLENIEAILQQANMGFSDVVKTEIYLKNLEDFQEMNTMYAQKFSHPIKPARQVVQVARLPLDALVEISCIAKTKIKA